MAGLLDSSILLIADAGNGAPAPVSLVHVLWDGFNSLISFTANIWQNIDGLVILFLGVYLLLRAGRSVLGHDESTVKTSTSFDYLGEFPRESDHKVFRLEEVWKLPFNEKTLRACFARADDQMPFVCVPNRGVWRELHDFYSGMRNGAVAEAVDLGRDRALRRVSHILGISFGNFEMRQPRIEDLSAPRFLEILRDPIREFQKAAISSRELEMARQLALIELAALVCWKAPHLVVDALMEPRLTVEALRDAPGSSSIEKKIALERQLSTACEREFQVLRDRGQRLGKLFLLDRDESYRWLSGLGEVPPLPEADQAAVARVLQVRQSFKPWTHRLVDGISQLPIIRKRFPHQAYVENVGRLDADGWFVRVYVNLLSDGSEEAES